MAAQGPHIWPRVFFHRQRSVLDPSNVGLRTSPPLDFAIPVGTKEQTDPRCGSLLPEDAGCSSKLGNVQSRCYRAMVLIDWIYNPSIRPFHGLPAYSNAIWGALREQRRRERGRYTRLGVFAAVRRAGHALALAGDRVYQSAWTFPPNSRLHRTAGTATYSGAFIAALAPFGFQRLPSITHPTTVSEGGPCAHVVLLPPRSQVAQAGRNATHQKHGSAVPPFKI